MLGVSAVRVRIGVFLFSNVEVVMAKLTSKQRAKLPASQFAGPGKSYPIPDKAHAIDAKARATQAVKAGRMSSAQAAAIAAKANKVLGKGSSGSAGKGKSKGRK